ncbi:MAG: DNA polymerase III, subunit gamma and tau [Bacteroidetes bacterium RIFCSPLOWO2_12_FULL_35_15]|nr:MAG: DNA polymerase III, subunit gamma and tau [Bacteroidetes bacterium RIFCSPLOWO2_12_FULL_35_15]
MDNFIVSARKYRPATFNTVVGQEHITNTLKNAIKTGHLAQAFLFCGPRGVGKTTCARILAKTINCTNRTSETEACDQCESCQSFNSGASHNVFELDAASNNSVDDIRNLVDQVRYAPQLGTHKVYIIDEVHMLSTSAFNAFLKTLEEPPKHAIFILATTEKHKIIPTILSRCQIFDFNRIQIDDIANHLAFIAKSENVTAETDALQIIAQKADGALRDACSIFDQIVSFAGNTVTYKAVIDNLNILDYDYYFQVTEAVLNENSSQALLIFNEILNNGFDGHNFVAGMGEHLRNLLVSKDVETIQLLEVGTKIRDKYKDQSGKCSMSFLVKGLTILNKTDIQYKSSKNHRLQVELALLQLCSINSIGTDTEKKNDLIKPIAKPKIPEGLVNSVLSTSSVSVKQPVITNEQPVLKNTPVNPESSVATVKKPLIKTSTPSIQQHLNSEKKTKNLSDNNVEQNILLSGQPKVPFTQQALEVAWNKYANGLKEKRAGLASALLSKRPNLTNETIVEFPINNKALEEAINEDKMNFLDFLRKELNNYSISMSLVMTVSEEKTNLYTATDRYKRLSEKNPTINKLRQAFDLDIEF